MPQMDGFQATRLIMERHPTPIVMATASSSKAETRGAFEALDAGALLLLDKPPAPWDRGPRGGGGRALRTVKLMAEVKVVRRWAARPRPGAAPPRFPRVRAPRVVAIGASTGGPQVLSAILAALPGAAQRPGAARPAHLRRLHRGLRRLARDAHADGGGARRARRRAAARARSTSPARIATWASTATPHRFDGGPPVNGFRPSISHLFDSVATLLRPRVGRHPAHRHGPRRRRRAAPDARRRRADDRPGRGVERDLRHARGGGPAQRGRRGALAGRGSPSSCGRSSWSGCDERDILVVEDSRTQAEQLLHLLSSRPATTCGWRATASRRSSSPASSRPGWC